MRHAAFTDDPELLADAERTECPTARRLLLGGDEPSLANHLEGCRRCRHESAEADVLIGLAPPPPRRRAPRALSAPPVRLAAALAAAFLLAVLAGRLAHVEIEPAAPTAAAAPARSAGIVIRGDASSVRAEGRRGTIVVVRGLGESS